MAFGPPSVPNVSPNEGGGEFSTLIEKFPLPKNPKITRIEDYAQMENFQLLVKNFLIW